MTITEPTSTRHEQELNHGMANLRKYANSSVDEWEYLYEKSGVKLYQKKPENPNEPMIYRGDYHYAKAPEFLTPMDATTPMVFSSSRQIFDNRFDESEIRVIRSRYSSISYGRSKAMWPISPRDFSTVTLRTEEDDIVYFGVFSVIDDEYCPPVDNFVRSNVVCSGWKIYRDTTNGGGLRFVTISQFDLAGSVPPALAKTGLQQLPLLASKLAVYHEKHGAPPNSTMVPETPVAFLGEDFDYASLTYTLNLGYSIEEEDNSSKKTTEQQAADIKVFDQVYPKGFDVAVQGDAQYKVTKSTKKNTYSVVHISNVVGSVTIQIVKPKKKK